MAISILNNIASIAAQNQLSITNASLNSSLLQLSSGSRINSGADDAAGLAVADGLQANIRRSRNPLVTRTTASATCKSPMARSRR